MTGELLKKRRIEAGISGAVLCRQVAMGRTRLCNIERGYLQITAAELERLLGALEELVNLRQQQLASVRRDMLAARMGGKAVSV